MISLNTFQDKDLNIFDSKCIKNSQEAENNSSVPISTQSQEVRNIHAALSAMSHEATHIETSGTCIRKTDNSMVIRIFGFYFLYKISKTHICRWIQFRSVTKANKLRILTLHLVPYILKVQWILPLTKIEIPW